MQGKVTADVAACKLAQRLQGRQRRRRSQCHVATKRILVVWDADLASG
jgi:hypothetical protein